MGCSVFFFKVIHLLIELEGVVLHCARTFQEMKFVT